MSRILQFLCVAVVIALAASPARAQTVKSQSDLITEWQTCSVLGHPDGCHNSSTQIQDIVASVAPWAWTLSSGGQIPLGLLSPCAATVPGIVPTPPNDATKFFNGQCSFTALPQTCANIQRYGGIGDNSTDNVAAFAAAVGSNVGNPCVYFPPGKYKFNSAVTYAFSGDNQALTVKGDGQAVTELTWPSSNAIAISETSAKQSVHFHDLLLTTGGTTFNGISVSKPTSATFDGYGPLSDFLNVTLSGTPGPDIATTNSWLSGILLTRVSNVNFVNVHINGTEAYNATAGTGGNGIVLAGGPGSQDFGIVYNFTNCLFNNLLNGIIYGNMIQGVAVNQSNFTGGYTGIGVPPGEAGLDELTVTGSQFNTGYVEINGLSPAADIIVQGNLFLIPPSAVAINVNSVVSKRFTANGNVFAAVNTFNSGQTGIAMGGSGGTVTGNTFDRLNTGVSLTGTGANVQSNSYNSVTTQVGGCSGNTCGGGSQ